MSHGYASAQALAADHQYQSGQNVIDSFSPATHGGDVSPSMDIAVGSAIIAGETAAAGALIRIANGADNLLDVALDLNRTQGAVGQTPTVSGTPGLRGGGAVQGGEVVSNKTTKDYGVAFFGEDNLGYYTRESATIGREGKTFFFMPLENSAAVRNAADAARYTGRAPSSEKAYLGGGDLIGQSDDIFGLSFPTNGMNITKPTAADAGGWPHYLEGGHTAIKTGDGPNAGYLVNPTREFVVPGGNAVPEGSVLFKLGPSGEWIPISRSF